MSNVTGVTIQKDNNGQLTHVSVDLIENPKALALLQEIGLVEKTEFERECEKGMDVHTFRRRAKDEVSKTWAAWKK